MAKSEQIQHSVHHPAASTLMLFVGDAGFDFLH